MSKRLPSKEEAIKILYESQCPWEVINHCEAVAELALKIAVDLKNKGADVDFDLVETGALLHDLGRSKTHTINHAIEGVKIAQSKGLPLSIINIIKRHVGGGITNSEAEKFDWPKDVYSPISLEEKIVSYADKCIDNNKKVPIETTIKQLQNEQKYDAAERVRKLGEEIKYMLG